MHNTTKHTVLKKCHLLFFLGGGEVEGGMYIHRRKKHVAFRRPPSVRNLQQRPDVNVTFVFRTSQQVVVDKRLSDGWKRQTSQPSDLFISRVSFSVVICGGQPICHLGARLPDGTFAPQAARCVFGARNGMAWCQRARRMPAMGAEDAAAPLLAPPRCCL